MPAVSSASGLLALLEEPSDDLKRYALLNLDKVVDDFWYQISGHIGAVEALYEDEEFNQRELAALLASKVFYHLGELDDALNYALGAGSLFNVNDNSEYVQTLIARCLDQYFQLRVKQVEQKEDVTIDDRLTAIVERMIERCCEQGQVEQAVGVALESRRLDKLEEVLNRSSDSLKALQYSLKVCQNLVVNRDFRQQVLRLLIRLYEAHPQKDYIDICQCLMFLDDSSEVAKILHNLLTGSEEDELLAYQIGFDLVENEIQSFLHQVQVQIDSLAGIVAAPPPAADAAAATAMETDAAPAAAAPAADADAAAPSTVNPFLDRFDRLKAILSGRTPTALYLDFLYRHNHADLQILKNIKGSVDARVSVTHSATILANAMMHAGTTVDTFLRENLDWLSRATNWAKFSATAGLGVIHRGHLSQGQALMAPYLPRNGNFGSFYSEGGALYALGLIYANHGQDIRTFLLESLRGTGNEVIQHGACLGLGLACLGSCDEDVFEDIKTVMYTDSAIAGEAAGIALGLLTVGSSSERAGEMLAYAHDTQHEKIIRGLALGLGLVVYGREEGAEPLIEQMTSDTDPIIRYGGMYAIGLAYRGTGNNAAIAKLLHYAVTDVSDDVRRGAVMCLGFVTMGTPAQCPKIVSLLAESYNPHVRYGAAMAVGLACGGTGLKEATALLEPLLGDAIDFVRQGALIAMALVMVQQPESKVAPLRKKMEKFISDKHEDIMCRSGAIVASGILDAGGRNVVLGIRARSGYFRRTSIVGLALFTQYWYWYPLSYCLSLAFQPTALIGVNKKMEMPVLSLSCACKPSLFAYPPPVTSETKEQTSKVAAAVLSTTARAKERAKKKEAEKKGVAATTPPPPPPKETQAAAAMETDEAAKPSGSAKEEEPSSYSLDNPARVLPAQLKFIQFKPDSRFLPVQDEITCGITVLRDLRAGEEMEVVAASRGAAVVAPPPAAAAAGARAAAQPAQPAASSRDEEPPPPPPFEYTP